MNQLYSIVLVEPIDWSLWRHSRRTVADLFFSSFLAKIIICRWIRCVRETSAPYRVAMLNKNVFWQHLFASESMRWACMHVNSKYSWVLCMWWKCQQQCRTRLARSQLLQIRSAIHSFRYTCLHAEAWLYGTCLACSMLGIIRALAETWTALLQVQQRHISWPMNEKNGVFTNIVTNNFFQGRNYTFIAYFSTSFISLDHHFLTVSATITFYLKNIFWRSNERTVGRHCEGCYFSNHTRTFVIPKHHVIWVSTKPEKEATQQ